MVYPGAIVYKLYLMSREDEGLAEPAVRTACKQCFRLPFRHGSLGECTTQDDRSHGMWIEYVKCLERRCAGKHRKGLALGLFRAERQIEQGV